ncbi:unnamed protein product [Schistosoma curassoni]|nr:unnamed protein product [Schistosoma curassoni]
MKCNQVICHNEPIHWIKLIIYIISYITSGIQSTIGTEYLVTDDKLITGHYIIELMKSISNHLFNTDYLILYRLIVIILYTISSQIGYFYFYPNNNEGIQLIQVLYLLKFFTCITMTLNAIYFITSIPLHYFNLDHIRGYQFLVVFSFNSTMMLFYWSAFLYDPKLIYEIDELKNMPLWYNHLCHLIPPVALVLDAYLCHPKVVSFYNALKIECFIGIVYNIL